MPSKVVASNQWGRFTPAEKEARYRLVGLSTGEEGTGKSHLWLTAPEPIAIHLLDPNGLEGLTNRPEFAGKDIRVINYRYDPSKHIGEGERMRAGEEVWYQFLEDYEVALKNARTIIWDKEDYIWEVFRYACYGAKTSVQYSYHELNMKFRSLVNDALNQGVNLGMIRGYRTQFRDNKPTNIREPRGWGEMPEVAQVCLTHTRDDSTAGAPEFDITVGKCKQNTALSGQTFRGYTFADLAITVFPETAETPEVWL